MRLKNLLKKCEREYLRRTPKSRRLHALTRKFLPGGDTRSIAFFEPYPFFTERAEGYTLHDADGNDYLDFVNNYASLVHGHAHPKIVAAIRSQLEKGWTYATGTKSQHLFAEILCKRFPSLEKVRLTNSGTEATMGAIRAARAFTGRDKILKMEGGYHGSHLSSEVSTRPELGKAGAAESPLSIPDGPGIPACVARD